MCCIGPEVALYGKDDVPTNLEIISLILLGSFLTLTLFLAASTFYYRRKVRALLIKPAAVAPAPANSNCNSLDRPHARNGYHNSHAANSGCNDSLEDHHWLPPPVGKAANKKAAAPTNVAVERAAAPILAASSFRGHFRGSSADILLVDDTVVDRYDLHGVKIETEYSDCDTMLPNGTR